MALFSRLNPIQEQAFSRNAATGDSLTDKVTIIESPPGTDKTRVIGITAINCLSENIKFMIVAETRYAVHIAADAIFAAIDTVDLQ